MLGISNHDDRIQCLQLLILLLPEEHSITLTYILDFLQKVSANSKFNLMNAQNLGSIMGPTLTWASADVKAVKDYEKSSELIQFMIENYKDMQIQKYPAEIYTKARKDQQIYIRKNKRRSSQCDALDLKKMGISRPGAPAPMNFVISDLAAESNSSLVLSPISKAKVQLFKNNPTASVFSAVHAIPPSIENSPVQPTQTSGPLLPELNIGTPFEQGSLIRGVLQGDLGSFKNPPPKSALAKRHLYM
jgi:hypothetical protein